MESKLLVRAYNVGFGDCIYVRIPNRHGGFHILIDCGTLGSIKLLRQAIEHLKSELPDSDMPGKKRLDLIVATHRHADHLKGFEAAWFEDIQVRNIWISVGMDPAHPQAKKVRQVRSLAQVSMGKLLASSKRLRGDVAQLASFFSATNENAEKLILETLPKKNKIEPKFVHSGMNAKELGLENLPAGTSIDVLGPERDIDHYYLGKQSDGLLQRFSSGVAEARSAEARSTGLQADPTDPKAPIPKNISRGDFEKLRSRMESNGLEFARLESSIQNNLSVVLMITWRKRRLLFVGDAEWNGEYAEGKRNGSWNVMWEMHYKKHLSEPIDFLKVGHHGSANSTPWIMDEAKRKKSQANVGIGSLLDTLLPVPKRGKPKASAILSTERRREETIPDGRLLLELGRRLGSVRNYAQSLQDLGIDPSTIWVRNAKSSEDLYRDREKPYLSSPQPLRTDLEAELSEDGQRYIEMEFEPGDR